MENLFFFGVISCLSGLLAYCVDCKILIFDDGQNELFDYEYEEIEYRNRRMRRVCNYAIAGLIAFTCTFFVNLPAYHFKRRNEC